MRACFVVLLIPLASCAARPDVEITTHGSFAEATSVCDVAQQPEKYVGREIQVVGIYGRAPHQRVLFDPKCPSSELALRIAKDSKSFEDDEKLQKMLENKSSVRTRVVYLGLIETEQVIGGCTKAACVRVAVSDARLLAFESIPAP